MTSAAPSAHDGDPMPQFAANLSMMYTEHAFLDRFKAAAADGFDAVEFLFPYDHPPAEIAARLADNGLKQVLFNAPPGDWIAGEPVAGDDALAAGWVALDDLAGRDDLSLDVARLAAMARG